MQKQKNTPLKQPVLLILDKNFRYFHFLNQKLAFWLIGLVGFVFYVTSINGEYALDDGIIIHQNDHVVKGVRGIKDILTKDAYESFYRRMCATDQLAGGRYRPLSAVSFAIEQEFIGAYRTGLYLKVEDSNKNNVLDKGEVSYTTPCGRPETNYEFNDYIDVNGDNIVQPNECYTCWDRNKNLKNDIEEDINSDGLFNEIDCQLYGAKFRHFNNIWTYALGCMLLYLVFSRYVFRNNQDLAFLAVLLFTMHPIHSEAVANVKSRDEIFSLIFIALTFFYSFRFIETKKTINIFWAGLVFLLALLSKEYAVTLLFLVPLSIYFFTENDFDFRTILNRKEDIKKAILVSLAFILCAFLMTYIKRDFDIHAMPGAKPTRSFWLFPFLYIIVGIFLMGANKKNNFLKLMSWFYFVVLFYIGMRWMAVKLNPGVPNTEILNNPYLLANGEERFCSKVYVLLKYFSLLCFPHPLSSDYSYNSIEYRHFLSWDFIVSLLLHIGLVVAAFYFTLKKHILGFALWVYILFALMIGNVLMDIGATMGERLIFHSSIGFCLAMAWLILKGLDKLKTISFKTKQLSFILVLLVVSFLYGAKTWERNFDWKNDITLFIKDSKTMPNSVLALGNAGARYVDLLSTKDFTENYVPGYDTTFNDYNGTLSDIIQEVKQGKYKTRREAAIHHGVDVLERAIALHPRYVNGYLNLGLLYFQLRKDSAALFNWKNAERLYPNNPYLRNYYGVYSNDLKNRGALAFNRGRMDSAAIAYNLLTILEPHNAEAWYNLGGAYFNQRRYQQAYKSWNKALAINPNYADVKRVLPMITPQMLGENPPVKP
ncbi:MAG: tetratricopeptide repeat protein [Bacteroidia bacterium]|nr:tetratricopeptide repeat protein [Bacteroidia bacterium]